MTQKKYRLFIDDLRSPASADWVLGRTSTQAIETMKSLGCPREISFDHDLGGDDTAMVVVKWMIERDLDENGAFIPPDFTFYVHSANPVGKANIEGLLSGYLEARAQNQH